MFAHQIRLLCLLNHQHCIINATVTPNYLLHLTSVQLPFRLFCTGITLQDSFRALRKESNASVDLLKRRKVNIQWFLFSQRI